MKRTHPYIQQKRRKHTFIHIPFVNYYIFFEGEVYYGRTPVKKRFFKEIRKIGLTQTSYRGKLWKFIHITLKFENIVVKKIKPKCDTVIQNSG